nr:hypothetical protein [Evansella caseinilytica]
MTQVEVNTRCSYAVVWRRLLWPDRKGEKGSVPYILSDDFRVNKLAPSLQHSGMSPVYYFSDL